MTLRAACRVCTERLRDVLGRLSSDPGAISTSLTPRGAIFFRRALRNVPRGRSPGAHGRPFPIMPPPERHRAAFFSNRRHTGAFSTSRTFFIGIARPRGALAPRWDAPQHRVAPFPPLARFSCEQRAPRAPSSPVPAPSGAIFSKRRRNPAPDAPQAPTDALRAPRGDLEGFRRQNPPSVPAMVATVPDLRSVAPLKANSYWLDALPLSRPPLLELLSRRSLIELDLVFARRIKF